MSIVKQRSSNGYYDGYGGGYSKPHHQVNYHQQNPECVTTVIKEISRMTVNQKPSYGGGVGDVLRKEEVIEEETRGYDGAAAVKKKQEYKFVEEKDSYHGGGAALKKHEYKTHQPFEADGGYNDYYNNGAGVLGGAGDGGYPLPHGGAAAVKNKLGYQHGGAYGGAGSYGSHHGGGDIHKYGGYHKDAYGAKADHAGGYGGGHYYGGNKQLQTDDFAYKQQVPYGGAITGVVQPAYDEADAGYGAGAYNYGGGGAMHQAHGGGYKQKPGYGGGAHPGSTVLKHAYKQEVYGKNAGGYGEAGGGHHHEAYERESDDDESDCDEAALDHPLARRAHVGRLQSYEEYKREKNGGGVRPNDECREDLGVGHRFF